MSLIPYAAIVAYVGTRPDVSRAAVWAIIAYNVLWSIDSVVLLVSGYVSPTALGYAFVIFQAAVVAGFAGLQVCRAAERGGHGVAAANDGKTFVPSPAVQHESGAPLIPDHEI